MRFPASAKHLLQLLADTHFRSGAELSRSLGIGRTMVWKHIGRLRDFGIEIESVKGKGYRLPQPLELLDKSTIFEPISTHAKSLINELKIFEQIDSTNAYLLESAAKDLSSGWVCIAESQTGGRGRLGRGWVSPFGCNLYLSLLWRFEKGASATSGLSLAAGVAVVRALKRLGINESGLKWPNDIVWKQRKLGGLLIELSGDSLGPCAVIVGLGINVHMPPKHGREISQDWVDLAEIAGIAKIGRNCLASAILNELLPIMANYESTGLTPYLREWRNHDCINGKWVNLYLGNRVIEGAMRGITDDGLLVIDSEQGELLTFASGEVSFRN